MMRKQRKQLLLLLILLVVVVGAYVGLRFANSKAEDDEESTTQVVVTTLTTDQITAMTFTNDYGTVILRKEGEEWLSADDNALDLDEETVDSMVSNIASLESSDEITDVTDLSIYGLDAPTKTIMISDGTTTETVFVGDYNSTVSKYYIYLEGKADTVYTVSSALPNAFEQSIDDLIAEPETTEETEIETETETMTDSQ